MTASPVSSVPTTARCRACDARLDATPGEDWTPLCIACGERLGTPVAIGEHAVCRVGSLDGRVRRFDAETWDDSFLAELRLADGGFVWLPLADLAPAR